MVGGGYWERLEPNLTTYSRSRSCLTGLALCQDIGNGIDDTDNFILPLDTISHRPDFAPIGMDSQLVLASKEDFWRLQNEMKNVYATQAEHSDRLTRLERRQDDDSRLKSVWGGQSPFPGILGGTPQQGLFPALP